MTDNILITLAIAILFNMAFLGWKKMENDHEKEMLEIKIKAGNCEYPGKIGDRVKELME
jgi:hypothetical protein